MTDIDFIGPAMRAFGVAATVTPVGGSAIATTVIWLSPTQETMPVGRDFERRSPRRILALKRADIDSLPRGSVIVVPEYGGSVARTWKVDNIDQIDAEQIRALVVPVD